MIELPEWLHEVAYFHRHRHLLDFLNLIEFLQFSFLFEEVLVVSLEEVLSILVLL